MAEHTPLHDTTARAGAVFVESGDWLIPDHYGDVASEYAHARRSAALFDLSHRGKLEVSGADARTFLHNLCTNDIKNLALGSGCEAFFTIGTAKVVGHVSIYHLLVDDNREVYWLDVPPGQTEKLLRHLDRYLISERVEFADRTREFALLCVAGPVADSALAACEPAISLVNPQTPLGLPGRELLCPREQAPKVWGRLVEAGAHPAGRQVYDILRVEAGTPIHGLDIDENRFVVEVGRMHAICYTKGCFLGQEPIVMVRDRGQLQRQLLGLRLTGKEPALPGSKVFREGKEVGVTATSVFSPALDQAIALAYLRRSHQTPGTTVEVEADTGKREAVVTGLPFSEQ